jgi:hypothetical protein
MGEHLFDHPVGAGRAALTARKRELSAIRLILMKPDLLIVADSSTCVDYNFPALAK